MKLPQRLPSQTSQKSAKTKIGEPACIDNNYLFSQLDAFQVFDIIALIKVQRKSQKNTVYKQIRLKNLLRLQKPEQKILG